MAQKTYKIEHQVAGNCWVLSHTWYGMQKSRTQGAMMVLSSMYGRDAYRALCEQTGEILDELTPVGYPTTQSTLDEAKDRVYTIKAFAKKHNVIIIERVHTEEFQ